MRASRKGRIPHVTRDVSDRLPHHVVMSFRRGTPQPHWKSVQAILFRRIREVSARYGACVSLACAMPGHVHLLVETRQGGPGLGDVMRLLASKLALEVNERFDRRGPVYEDRYFSRVLRTLSELVRGIRYIAMNPVKARLCRHPADWMGSAARDYLRNELTASPWRFRGWMFWKLGFHEPRTALEDILAGRRQPVISRGGRQLKLPFARGLPARP